MAITGTGSGFGLAICDELSKRGFRTLSIGRSHSPDSDFQITVDFAKAEDVSSAAAELRKFNLIVVILNAFKFGAVGNATQISTNDIENNLQVNLYAQKIIVDSALKIGSLEEVVAISSGAARNGYAGWLHYCLGKAALDSMMGVYAKEISSVKFWSCSPGVLEGGLNQNLLESPVDYEWKEKLRTHASSPKIMASSLVDLIQSKSPLTGEWIKL